MDEDEIEIIDSVERRKELLKRLKENIEIASFPPNYDVDFDFYNNNSGKFNCYAYAMQFRELAYDEPHFLYRPGFLTNLSIRTLNYTEEILMNLLLSDFELLGIDSRESTMDETPTKNSYKIGIFTPNKTFITRSFHIYRQNDDLSWSKKSGYYHGTEIVTNPYDDENYDLKRILMLSRKK
jgi:hypothetical protein